MAHHSFEKGDVVRLKTGSARIVLTRIGGDSVCGFYPTPQGPQHPFTWRKANDFIRFEEEPPMTTTDPLYALKSDPTLMGRIIGTNSEGKKVFEIRPSNELKIVDAGDLEEILPFTIRIDGVHYSAPKDVFRKHDVLLWPTDGAIYTVDELDTKNRNPKTLPKGVRRLVTEEI